MLHTLCLRTVARADTFILSDTHWHVTLCRFAGTIDLGELLHALRESDERLVRGRQFPFTLSSVHWTSSDRYLHLGIEGGLAVVAAALRDELCRAFPLHVSGATRRSAGVLHLAIPAFGQGVPDTPV